MKLRSLLGLLASAVFVVGCSQTDAGITTSVKSKLAADDLVKARQIDVDTQDHIVTLNGTVQTSEEEAQALQIARNTKGVTSVVDNIEVQGSMEQGSAPTSGSGDVMMGGDAMAGDDALAAQVRTALEADSAIQAQQITVEAKDGVVTMSGTVDSNAAKTKAAEVAGNVTGVTRVDDKLTVK